MSKFTPGPWKAVSKGNSIQSNAVVSAMYGDGPKVNICSGISPSTANADFIAHSREDMEWLLTLTDALKAQLASTLTRAEATEAERDAAVKDLKLAIDWPRSGAAASR